MNGGWFLKFAGLIIIIAGVFTIVWTRSSIKSLEYRMARLQVEEQLLIKQQRNLMAGKDDALSLRNLSKMAKNIGLDIPDRNRVFYVKAQKGSEN